MTSNTHKIEQPENLAGIVEMRPILARRFLLAASIRGLKVIGGTDYISVHGTVIQDPERCDLFWQMADDELWRIPRVGENPETIVELSGKGLSILDKVKDMPFAELPQHLAYETKEPELTQGGPST